MRFHEPTHGLPFALISGAALLAVACLAPWQITAAVLPLWLSAMFAVIREAMCRDTGTRVATPEIVTTSTERTTS